MSTNVYLVKRGRQICYRLYSTHKQKRQIEEKNINSFAIKCRDYSLISGHKI